MNNQESMFEPPESTLRGERPYNANVHEPYEQSQWVERSEEEGSGEEGYEGYAGYERPHIDGGMRQLGDGKIRPQRPKTKPANWLIALAIGLPLFFFIALGGIGMTFGRIERGHEWGDRGHYNWDKGAHSWNMGGRASNSAFFRVGAQPTLIINDASGTVHIRTGDAGQVVVGPQGENNGQDGFGDVSSRYDLQNNVVTINAQDQAGPGSGFSRNDNSADLEITVPTDSSIQVQTVSGDVDVEGVNGQLTLTTDSGNVSVSGKLQGQSVMKTGDGNVTFDGTIDPQGSYVVETSNGDVSLSLPGDSSFALSTKTTSGVVNNEFGNTHIGTSPQPQLSINTQSGTIELRKAR